MKTNHLQTTAGILHLLVTNPCRTITNRFISRQQFVLSVLFLLTGAFLPFLVGCGDKSTNEESKCDPVGEITDDTGRWAFKAEELSSGTGPYYSVNYAGGSSGNVAVYFERNTKSICTEEPVATLAGFYIQTPPPEFSFELSFSIGDYRQEYQYTKSGAGQFGTHYQGSGLISVPHDQSLSQKIILRFPNQGSLEANAQYLQDTLKLYIQFRNLYHKAK
jgi:hypothetical protein